MTKKPVFWIVCSILFTASVLFTLKYFPKAYPIVSLDLQMDRQAAVETASGLAEKYGWGPEQFRQAAVFGVDEQVKNYVELEIGGADAFRNLIQKELYFPYTWRVRLFRENTTNETLVRFTPEGSPYGFREKLAEDEPGPSLSADSALAVAVTAARETWNVDLQAFSLVEKAKELRPGGRTDHTFVYERTETTLGEARYRLRLVVSGNKLTELTHFVKIPEAFSRMYQEMRSANNTIATSALIAAAILYIVGGCVIGLFLLLKQGWVLWRKALFWGLFVAFMQVLAQINQWPLSWMTYDTALTAQWFMMQQIVMLLLTFLGEGLLLTLTFMAAESLTRKAFPNHIQFWRIWSSDTAGSKPVLGRTIGGYLAVGFFLAFDVGLYFFASKVLGWWTPSSPLFDPNILATYMPWLSSIAISLHAGFWEECLFRAIPIAGAVLLGKRYGKTALWVIGAFIVQALVFGSAHANYAQQPSYARVVELIIPSVGFGLLYFYLGLLPAIVLHYVVDVVYIGMPLFVSTAPGIWIDRTLIILFTLVPLAVVLYRRIRAGKWQDITQKHCNASWKPAEKPAQQKEDAPQQEKQALSPAKGRILMIAGIAGLAVWFFFGNFQNHAPDIKTQRTQAMETARQALADRNIELSDTWQLLSSVQEPLNDDDRFIWQTAGEEAYKTLMGSFISPPRWRCRFVQFEGDVAEKAEEYQVYINGSGSVIRFRHILPEDRAGAELDKDAAQDIAVKQLLDQYNLNAADLKPISAEPSKLPGRRDWAFTWADTANHPLEQGQARIAVTVSGDRVTDSYRYIHIPEEWQRQQRNKANQNQIITILMTLAIAGIFISGAVYAIIRWSKKQFSVSFFLIIFLSLLILGVIKLFNSWQFMMSQFSTAEPFANQLYIAVAASVIVLLFMSAGFGLINGFIYTWKPVQAGTRSPASEYLAGFGTGLLIVGLLTLLESVFKPSLTPVWADYGALNNSVPLVNLGLGIIPSYIMAATLGLIIFITVDRGTQNWTRRKVLYTVLLFTAGFLVSGASPDSIQYFLVAGAATGIIYVLLYVFVLRFNLAVIPVIVAAEMIINAAEQGITGAFPASVPGNAAGIIVIGLISFFWYKALRKA